MKFLKFKKFFFLNQYGISQIDLRNFPSKINMKNLKSTIPSEFCSNLAIRSVNRIKKNVFSQDTSYLYTLSHSIQIEISFFLIFLPKKLNLRNLQDAISRKRLFQSQK